MTNRPTKPLLSAIAAALLCGAGGCASMDRAMLGADDTDHYAAFDQPPPKESAWDKMLIAGGFKKRDTLTYVRPTVPPEAQKAYDDAKAMYDNGKYAESEKAAHALVKKWKNTVLEEDALFLEAESQYARKRYASATDTYSELFERFPSTRYMDTSTAHLFEISQYWLQFPKVVKSAEVQPANFEDPGSSPLPKPAKTKFDVTRSVPFLPNVVDRSRPAFDTEGRALEALKSIWLNDPTGPLADDALMLCASYHLRNGAYEEADHYYGILREEYPKSPHLEDAFVLGSHVKLMAYEGPAYDGKTLEEARRLKESTLRLFPQTAERGRLEDELKKTADAKAARQWQQIKFYQGKDFLSIGKGRYQKSVAVACHALLTDYPNCKYAPEARRIWNELPPDTKQYLPPLPSQPRVVNEPSLNPVPGETADGDVPATGRASL